MENTIFNTLNNINVNDKVEQKNGLNYLAWAFAWGEVKKLYPNANYTIYERETEHGPVNYFTDGMTCWVKTGVTIEGLEHIEELPVMDFKNKSIPLEKVTSFDVNKSIQRSLTKAIGRHGLGLYIYAGEDLPEEEKTTDNQTSKKETKSNNKQHETDVITLHAKLVALMDSYSLDFREKHNQFILEKTGLKTQNISELSIQEIERLCKFYKNFVEAYKKELEKKNKK